MAPFDDEPDTDDEDGGLAEARLELPRGTGVLLGRRALLSGRGSIQQRKVANSVKLRIMLVNSRERMPRTTARRVVRPNAGFAILHPLLQTNFELLKYHTDWRRTWSHIVAGKFSPSPYSDLLFYEQSTGYTEFYETNGAGGISLLRADSSWRTSWAQIVPGTFGKSGFSGLLLYDQQAGFGAFYDTDGAGNLIKLSEDSSWRNSWTLIIAGRFTDSAYSSLLFYDQSAGFGAIYSTDGAGHMTLIREFDDWRQSWTHIAPGEFYNPGAIDSPIITDLFFYEGAGYGETYANDGNGNITLNGSQQGLPPATILTPGNFGGTGWTNLLFYDKLSGRGSFQSFDYVPEDSPTGSWSSAEEHTEWPLSCDLIIPGNFWMADPEDHNFVDGGFTDLLFYDRQNGNGKFYLHEPLNSTPIEPFAGYASTGSVYPGETITFHVASQVGPYRIQIYRQGAEEMAIAGADLVATPADPLPINRMAYRDGAGWPAVASLTVPTTWPTGLYFARVHSPSLSETLAGSSTEFAERAIGSTAPSLDIPFVVRATGRGNNARILVVIPDTTYEAYNYWGGRSLYGYGFTGGMAWAYPQTSLHTAYGFRVSFLRPHTALGDEADKWKFWEVPFVRWLDKQGIRADFCTASDLDDSNASAILSRYKLVVTVGHSEYWSKNMKENVQNFLAGGGNAAFFGANICYWQVRFEDVVPFGRRMICYKQSEFDPNSFGSPDQKKTVTINWRDIPGNLDTKLVGVSYGWWNLGWDPSSLPAFAVHNSEHWAFANTGLKNGDYFGLFDDSQRTIVGGETDRRQETTPQSFNTLAIVRAATEEVATMGIFTYGVNGGTVFTAATLNWSLGLSQDSSWNPMDQITRNILIRLG